VALEEGGAAQPHESLFNDECVRLKVLRRTVPSSPWGRDVFPQEIPARHWADVPHPPDLWNPDHKSPVAEGDSTQEVSDTSVWLGGEGSTPFAPCRSTGRNELLSKRRRSQPD
jgi:hypothetical protein